MEKQTMTLLTPAVLHCSALEHIKDESPKFHRKYVLHFALMQGLWGVILFLLCFATIILPKAAYLRETGEKVLTNANFSKVSIKGDLLNIDIKPSIWVFTISDSTRAREEFIVDSTGKMNRFYWDDRIEKGEVKQFNGMGITKDWLLVKNGTQIRKVQYSKLTMGKDVEFTKSQLNSFLIQNTDKTRLLKFALILTPLIFVFTVLFGALLHGVYRSVIGYLLALLTRGYTRTVTQCIHVASGLYVAWSYVFVLSLIGQKVVVLTLGNLSSFFLVINIFAFATVVAIGYLYMRTVEEGLHKSAITKVIRTAR